MARFGGALELGGVWSQSRPLIRRSRGAWHANYTYSAPVRRTAWPAGGVVVVVARATAAARRGRERHGFMQGARILRRLMQGFCSPAGPVSASQAVPLAPPESWSRGDPRVIRVVDPSRDRPGGLAIGEGLCLPHCRHIRLAGG
jgi:hypothetical protein